MESLDGRVRKLPDEPTESTREPTTLLPPNSRPTVLQASCYLLLAASAWLGSLFLLDAALGHIGGLALLWAVNGYLWTSVRTSGRKRAVAAEPDLTWRFANVRRSPVAVAVVVAAIAGAFILLMLPDVFGGFGTVGAIVLDATALLVLARAGLSRAAAEPGAARDSQAGPWWLPLLDRRTAWKTAVSLAGCAASLSLLVGWLLREGAAAATQIAVERGTTQALRDSWLARALFDSGVVSGSLPWLVVAAGAGAAGGVLTGLAAVLVARVLAWDPSGQHPTGPVPWRQIATQPAVRVLTLVMIGAVVFATARQGHSSDPVEIPAVVRTGDPALLDAAFPSDGDVPFVTTYTSPDDVVDLGDELDWCGAENYRKFAAVPPAAWFSAVLDTGRVHADLFRLPASLADAVRKDLETSDVTCQPVTNPGTSWFEGSDALVLPETAAAELILRQPWGDASATYQIRFELGTNLPFTINVTYSISGEWFSRVASEGDHVGLSTAAVEALLDRHDNALGTTFATADVPPALTAPGVVGDETAACGQPLAEVAPYFTETIRIVHAAACRRDYQAILMLMDDIFDSDAGQVSRGEAVREWQASDPNGENLARLAAVLETTPTADQGGVIYQLDGTMAYFPKFSSWSVFVLDCHALSFPPEWCTLPEPPEGAFEAADWNTEITSLDCATTGEGIQVDAAAYGDVTGDGVDEAIVAASCVPSTSSWPNVVEMYGAESGGPSKIADLLGYDDGVDGRGLRVAAIHINNGSVVVVSAGYETDDPNATPTQEVTDTFTWRDGQLVRGERTITRR